jgi:hypothetical protein
MPMPFYSPRDPGFWDMEPDFLKPVQEACKPFGLDILHFVLGDRESPATPVAAVLRMPPGYVLPRHAHSVVRFEVVVEGSLEVDGRVLRPGDVMVSEANEFYGPHTAGPDGCTTVEVFSSITGTGNAMMTTPDGATHVDFRTPE